MPDINDLQYGYSSTGVDKYLEDIKVESLEKAKTVVQEISRIKTVCENEWEGQSREQFLENLQHDAEFVAQQFDELYEVLDSTVRSAQAAMANKDSSLIK